MDRGRGGPPRSVALPPPEDLGPEEELVAGRRPVEEAFVARRPAIRLLVVPQRRSALEKLVLHATNLRIPIVEVEGGSLTALAGFDGHQGVALVVEPRRFASLDDVLARAAERGEPPFILVLDSLEDPHNVGTLLRSAEAAGVHGVLFPTHRQAPLSPSAVKASAGAIEHLLLCPVDDLPGALSDLHSRGVRVAGAEGDAPMTARETDLRGPLAIVVGSEGQGLGPTVRRRCDLFMRIPMKGVVGSLNAAVAGSILLFEALAQRDPNAMPTPPESLPSPLPAADDPVQDVPTAESAKPAARKGRAARIVAEASGPEDPAEPATEPATPKPRARVKGLTTQAPSEADPPKRRTSPKAPSAEAPAEPKAVPAVRKRRASTTASSTGTAPTEAGPDAPAPDPPSEATAKSKRPRKTTTASAAPPSPDAADADADLLPADGAVKPASKRKPRQRAD